MGLKEDNTGQQNGSVGKDSAAKTENWSSIPRTHLVERLSLNYAHTNT